MVAYDSSEVMLLLPKARPVTGTAVTWGCGQWGHESVAACTPVFHPMLCVLCAGHCEACKCSHEWCIFKRYGAGPPLRWIGD